MKRYLTRRRVLLDASDPVDPFIDPEGYHALITRSERRFRDHIAND